MDVATYITMFNLVQQLAKSIGEAIEIAADKNEITTEQFKQLKDHNKIVHAEFAALLETIKDKETDNG